jgi:opacity protein-like surface antigen
LKLKLILIAILAFGSMAHAQGFVSHLSVGAGFEGIFPASTFTKSLAETNDYPNTQATTTSVGAVADVRYDFGHHSAFDIALTVNRSTELFYYSESGNVSRIQSNNGEMIGSYIFRLPAKERVKPYFLLGGGLVRFSPNNNSYNTGIPSTDTKIAFAYGFGSDFKISDHWGLRLQYRGLLRTDPDFKLLNNVNNAFGTGVKAHVPEPSIQIVYHF